MRTIRILLTVAAIAGLILTGIEAAESLALEQQATAMVEGFFGDRVHQPDFSLGEELIALFGREAVTLAMKKYPGDSQEDLAQMMRELRHDAVFGGDELLLEKLSRGAIVRFREETVKKDQKGERQLDQLAFATFDRRELRPLLKDPEKVPGRAQGVRAKSKTAAQLERTYSIRPAKGRTTADLLAELRGHPLVESVSPDYPVELLAIPNDTHFAAEQWSLRNTGQQFTSQYGDGHDQGTAGADIKWLEAYNSANWPTGEIVIAVVDSGVDYTHPDLVNKMWHNPGEIPDNGIDDDENGYVDDYYGYDFANGDPDPQDGHGHGTHCSGTIAAELNNNEGIVGVCPRAKIMGLKGLTDSGSGYSSDLTEGVIYAAEMGAQVINNSYGGSGFSQSAQDAVTYANELGVSFVASRGNSNVERELYPACYAGATSITALDCRDEKAWFSSYSSDSDLASTGVDILSCLSAFSSRASYVAPGYTLMSGTSMSGPTAAGVFGLLRLKFPGYTPWIYEQVMKRTADTNIYTVAGNADYIGKLGTGRTDANAALAATNAMAFVYARPTLGSGYSENWLSPGMTTNIAIRIGTWVQPMSNLTIAVASLNNKLAVTPSALYAVGNLAAGVITNLPEADFTLKIASTAPLGTALPFKVTLKQGSTVLAEYISHVSTPSISMDNPLMGDINGDGVMDLVGMGVSGVGYNLYCMTEQGAVRWIRRPAVDLANPSYSTGAKGQRGSMGDVTGDGTNNYVATFLTSESGSMIPAVVVYDGDGNPLAHYDFGPQYGSRGPVTSSTLAQLDDDPELEILLAYCYDSLDAVEGQVVRLDWDGTTNLVEGWSSSCYSYVAAGDVDGDGSNEVVVLRTDRIDVRDGGGNLERSIACTPATTAPKPLSIGDLTGDGRMEIVYALRIDPVNADVYEVYDLDGNRLCQVTAPAYGSRYVGEGVSPALGDLDGDGDLEIVCGGIYSSIMAWHHDGRMVEGFGIYDGAIGTQAMDAKSPLLTDVSGDGLADVLYLQNWDVDSHTLEIQARDAKYLPVQGYPKQMNYDNSASWAMITAELMMRPDAGFSATSTVATLYFGGVQSFDAGASWSEKAAAWPVYNHDVQQTRCRPFAESAQLRCGFYATNRYITAGQSAVFRAHVSASNTTGLVYSWDFDGDYTPELSGAGLSIVTNTYNTPGEYTVRLTVSNAGGESHTSVREDYITVYDTLSADFSATPTSGYQFPLRVQFTDLSTDGDFWSWTFGDGSTSTEQHPGHVYTSAGPFTVSLTVSNLAGASDVETKTSYISFTGGFGPVTNHYVSKAGKHLYPFKNWDEAATNVTAAIEAVHGDSVLVPWGPWEGTDTSGIRYPAEYDGHTVWIEQGVYHESGQVVIGNSDTLIKGIRGPELTVLDYQYGEGGLKGSLFITNAVYEGITVRNVRNTKTAASGMTFFNAIYGEGPYAPLNCGMRNCRIENGVTEGFISFGQHTGFGLSGDNAFLENCTTVSNKNNFTGFIGKGNNVTITNCVFMHNDGYVGLLYNGDNQVLANCLIAENTVSGPVLTVPYMYNNTITANIKTDGTWPTIGAITYGVPTMYNNVIYGNTGQEFDLATLAAGTARVYNNICEQNLNNCLAPFKGGNKTTAPVFYDAAAGNYRMAVTSPAIDGGTNFTVFVATNDMYISIDLGGSEFVTTDPGWNNVVGGAAGLRVADLINTNGDSTGYSFYLERAADAVISNGLDSGYPFMTYEAKVDAIGWTNQVTVSPDGLSLVLTGDPQIRIGGLNDNKVYNLGMYKPEYGPTEVFHRGGVSEFAGYASGAVYPSNGEFRVRLNVSHTYDDGRSVKAQAFRILDQQGYDDTPLSYMVDLDGLPRIYNGTPDVGCYEYNGGYPPTAVLDADPVLGPSPLSVNLSATNSYDVAGGSITNYIWDFGDGSPVQSGATLTNLTHVFTNTMTGSYSNYWKFLVTLRVQDDDGMLSAPAKQIITTGFPVPDAPEPFTGVAVTNDPPQIQLTWDDVLYETGYELARGELSGDAADLIVDDDDFNLPGHTGRDLSQGQVSFRDWEWIFPYRAEELQHFYYPGTTAVSTAWGTPYSTDVRVIRPDIDPGDRAYPDDDADFMTLSNVVMNYRHNFGDYYDNNSGYAKSMIWAPNLKDSGDYEVYVWYPEHKFQNMLTDGRGKGGAANSVTVHPVLPYVLKTGIPGELDKTFIVDQNENTGRWVSLGTHRLQSGANLVADTYMVTYMDYVALYDAVRFVKRADFVPFTNLAANVTNFLDSSAALSQDGTYSYYIRATNATGKSGWTPCTVHIPTTNHPPVPQITFVSATNGLAPINISVQGSATDDEGFIVAYEWDFGDLIAGSIQRGDGTFTHASYTYRVNGIYKLKLTVTDNQGYKGSTSVTVSVQGAAPPAPTGLAVSPIGENTIRLNWSDNSGNEAGFEIQRKLAPTGTFATIGSRQPNTVLHDDGTVVASVSYTYRVRAANEWGLSSWSNEATTNTVDGTLPTVVGTSATASNKVLVTFSEDMDRTTAETADNYAVTLGIGVRGAVRETNHAQVTLTTDPLTPGLQYTLVVNDVEDEYGGNSVPTDSTTYFSYIAKKSIYFDFGDASGTTPGNWNNVPMHNVTGLQVTNAVDQDGDATGIDLNLLTTWNGDGSSGTTGHLYPDTAQVDYFYTSTSEDLRIEGLDTNRTYDLIFYGSRALGGESFYPDTDYIVGAASVTLACLGNSDRTVSVTGVAPDTSGHIAITVDDSADDGNGYLSVLEIRYEVTIPPAILVSTTSVSVPEGSTNSFGVKLAAEPASVVTVTVERVSGDSDFIVQSGSSLVFNGGNWAIYQYSVLAAAQDADWFDSSATIRCSSPGLTDVDVTATENDNELDPLYSLPWQETFENDGTNAGALGALHSQHGWTASAAMVTNADAHAGTQSCQLGEGQIDHVFTDDRTEVWITMWARPVFCEVPSDIPAGASAVFYVYTNGHIVAYSNNVKVQCADVTLQEGEWSEFLLHLDYPKQTWDLDVNGTTVVSSFSFHPGAGTDFNALRIVNESPTRSWMDSIQVTVTDPGETVTVDSDGDGMPDSFELEYCGNITNLLPEADSDEDGMSNLGEYIAGLIPTNAGSVLQLSSLLESTPGSYVMQWGTTMPGRVYAIWWTSNLLSGFGGAPMESNLPPTQNVYTDSIHNVQESGYYRIGVRLE